MGGKGETHPLGQNWRQQRHKLTGGPLWIQSGAEVGGREGKEAGGGHVAICLWPVRAALDLTYWSTVQKDKSTTATKNQVIPDTSLLSSRAFHRPGTRGP